MSEINPSILVAGGGGFIGGQLARTLRDKDFEVRVADIKPMADWYQVTPGVDSCQLDLSRLDDCRQAVDGRGYCV
ncbi:MAG: NAD-dependent epimerase/dehydratase family protein [Mycobacterium sp.]